MILEEKRYLGWFQKVADLAFSPGAEKVITMVASFLAGFLGARGLVFGRYAPFGVAVVAAVPKSGLWFSVIGAAVGYLVPSAAYVPARYIAAAAAVGAIRWSLSELKKLNTHGLFAPAITFLPLIATGMTMVLINRSNAQTAALYVAESFLGSGCAYFFTRAGLMLGKSRRKLNFDTADIASLTITAGIMVMAFTDITIAGVSLGRMFMVLMILCCANAGGIAGGAVAGVTAGAIQGLSVSGLTYLSGAYGLGGLMAGVFSGVGKLVAAVAFIIANGVASLQVGDASEIVIGTIEVAIATLIYMVLPRSRRIAEIFGDHKERLAGDTLRSSIISRLNFAADALSHVSDSVEEISKKLTVTPGVHTVLNSAVGEVCTGCSRCTVCWKKEKEAKVKAFTSMTGKIKSAGKVTAEDFPEEITENCRRVPQLRDSVNKYYRDLISAQALELKSAQIRKITGDQFEATSGLLKDIAEEFSTFRQYDHEAADRVEEIFERNGVELLDVCCRIDKYDRMTVEAELSRSRQTKLNKAYITREISNACGRAFSQPCVSLTGEVCRLIMTQKPSLDAAFGYFQHSADNSTFCGDNVTGFYDGQGHYIAIISDGMGTGGRAAVDGVMASSMAETLIKAGIGFNTALRLINSALMAKSGDESLATLDITSVDLFTGKTEFRKAGAVGTFVRRGRRVDYFEEISMPVGIMDGISFATFEESLRENDMIVMVSDGATVCGTDWIKELIGDFEDDDPEYLAKQIVTEARKQRNDGHDDDITALAIKIK